MSKHRQQIREVLRKYLPDPEGPLAEYIACLQSIQEEFIKTEYSSLHIEIDYDYEGSQSYVLYGYRSETDKEYNKRLKQETKIKEQSKIDKETKKEKDFKLYQRLKKRFEGQKE